MPESVNKLVDKFGRHVDYIRLSVTDRCDFRCVYCMTEDMTFLPRTQILTLEELYQIAKASIDEVGILKEPLTKEMMLKKHGNAKLWRMFKQDLNELEI